MTEGGWDVGRGKAASRKIYLPTSIALDIAGQLGGGPGIVHGSREAPPKAQGPAF